MVNGLYIYFHQPTMFLLTKSQLKDHKGGHNEPHGETSPATTALLSLDHAHEVVDLLSAKGSPFKKFPEFRGVLKGVDKLVDFRLVLEVFGELGDCLAGDVQPFQYVAKVTKNKILLLARILLYEKGRQKY